MLALVLAAAALVMVLADVATTSTDPVNEAQQYASPPAKVSREKTGTGLASRKLAVANPCTRPGGSPT
ncbi:hypothetical protein ACFQ0B_29215 [Nonomuraea thailandensis]